MRVLVLTTDGFGGRGGIAKYNRDMLTALCSMTGCEEVVAIPRIMPNVPESMPPNLKYLTSGLGGKLRYVRAVLGMATQRFDLVLCGHINLLPLAALVRLRFGSPLALMLYGIEAWQPHRSRLVNWLARRLDTVFSISKVTSRKFAGWSGVSERNISILPNAIELKKYGAGPKSPNLLARHGLKGKTVFMTFGRLAKNERYKGVDEVLEAMSGLLDQRTCLAYLVAGDGDDRPRLEAKACELGLESHVVFAGYLSEDEKSDYYRLADAYVMPSRGEGFGFVFLEAMACGIPTVASTLDGGREALLDGKLGLLVNPDNLEELQASMLQALERQRVVPSGLEYFSYANFAARLEVAVLAAMKGHLKCRQKER
jgi:phosphatidylinositol alpha-1,6-mannosyltransferase